jgi:hypothetical protein
MQKSKALFPLATCGLNNRYFTEIERIFASVLGYFLIGSP